MVGTEFEVKDSNPGDWKEYIYTDEERAQITEEMMTQYYSHPLVTGLNAWSTINDDIKALIDYTGTPTRNGLVWYYVHRIRYATDAVGTTDNAGLSTARAFKGNYDLTVTYNGKEYPATLTLSSNQTLVVMLDDVNLAEQHYAEWVAIYPALGSSTNQTDNPDGDTLNNLAEYAMGGDPTDEADIGHRPAVQLLEINNTNYFEYVHVQRNDAHARGLTYFLETTDHLSSNLWLSANAEEVGNRPLDAQFITVTNRIPL